MEQYILTLQNRIKELEDELHKIKYGIKNYEIYKITNTINNKCYIGLTCQWFNTRLKQHLKNAYNNITNHKTKFVYDIVTIYENNKDKINIESFNQF